MIKSLAVRLGGLVLAVVAFVPAVVTVFKNLPLAFVSAFRPLYHPLWWWRWVAAWMPAIRAPWKTASDAWVSLPGLLAVAAVAIGLGIFFHRNSRHPPRNWEDEP
jgi:hypothetical protein